MNRGMGIFIGLLAILLIITSGVYLVWRGRTVVPSTTTSEYPPVNTAVLQSDLLAKLKTLDINASNLPFTVTQEEIGRDNPFSNY